MRLLSSRVSLTGREATPSEVPAEWKFFCFSLKPRLLVHNAGMEVAETQGTQSSISSDTGPREITASLACAPHPSVSGVEGHLRPGMPPEAVQSSRKRGADPGVGLQGESGAERKRPRVKLGRAGTGDQSQDAGTTWRQVGKGVDQEAG